MTDDHNDMHEDAHDEETVIAGDAVHEAPSDYEFADDHGTTSHNHIDEHGSLSADATDAPAARRRSLMPILAAVGGVLVLGGVAWWQFGGASSSTDASFMPASAPISSSVPAPISPAPAPVDAAPLAPAAPPALPVAATTAAAPVSPSMAPDGGMPPTSATALPTSPDNTPNLKPADVLNAASAPKPAPVMPIAAPAIVTAPVVVTAAVPTSVALVKTPISNAPMLAVPLPNGANGNANIQSLASRMDVLQKDVEHLTTQLGQMTNALAASVPPSGNQDIQHRLDVLEQKIATLHSGDVVSTPSIVTEEKPAARHMVVKHKPQTHKAVQVKIHKPINLTAAAPKPLTSKLEEKWVLRSATPDQAWISDSNSSRDLKQVKVGDTVPTIGRVTAIRQLGDDWVVQGTKGQIQ